MTDLTQDAAWVLLVTFVMSFLYELYRATVKAGTSRHDTMNAFLLQIPVYITAGIVIALLFSGYDWASWVGLLFSGAAILVSIFYYNPRIMIERQPGIIDWFEDLVFTGLLFVAAAILIYDITGK